MAQVPNYSPREGTNQERVLAHLAAEDQEIEVARRVIASLGGLARGLQMSLDVKTAQRAAFIERFCKPETPEIPATPEPL